MKFINTLKIKRAINWFDHRPLRERAMLVAAVVALMYFFVDVVIIGVSEARTKTLRSKLVTQATALSTVRKDIAELSKLAAQKPVSQEVSQFETMKRSIAEADELLAHLDRAPRAGDVVKALLSASPGLQLVSLKTLPISVALDIKAPAAPAANSPANAKAAPDPKAVVKPQLPVRPPRTIYRHGIEITVKGSYLDLLAYLEKLQNYSGRLYWADMSVDVQSHPDANLKMIIHTISGQSDPSLG
jgi:MSHA biogenesis protein MshJ